MTDPKNISLSCLRRQAPTWLPDALLYASFAASQLGLDFQTVGPDGLCVTIGSGPNKVRLAGGACSYFPQNNATAASIAADKYFSNQIFSDEGLGNLGGEYFFVRERGRSLRPPRRERIDACNYFRELGGTAFAKPLRGSRGDFAQPIFSELMLVQYMERLSDFHDAFILQRRALGEEMRVLVMNDDVIYCASKHATEITSDTYDGVLDAVTRHNEYLHTQGLSGIDANLIDVSLGDGDTRGYVAAPGRNNLSTGGVHKLNSQVDVAEVVFNTARRAVRALGLCVGGVDVIVGRSDDNCVRVVEVNANPSYVLLEKCGRHDLILEIWRRTFSAMGLSIV